MAVEFRYANVNEYQRVSDFLDEHWAKGSHLHAQPRLVRLEFSSSPALGFRTPIASRWPSMAPNWSAFWAGFPSR